MINRLKLPLRTGMLDSEYVSNSEGYLLFKVSDFIASIEQNAAHIVKCVNAHDELVALVKELRAREYRDYLIEGFPERDAGNNHELKRIDAILTKAGAKP